MKFVQSCKLWNFVYLESTDNLEDFRHLHGQVLMHSKVECQTIHVRPGELRHRLNRWRRNFLLNFSTSCI
jgi:IS1 family transposase